MLVAIDLDNTIDAWPSEFQSIMTALRAAGHRVVVLSGTSDPTVTQQDCNEKAEYLEALGLAECWDQIVVVPHPVATNKAEWLVDNRADLLIDNATKNAKAAEDQCLVLVPWQTQK